MTEYPSGWILGLILQLALVLSLAMLAAGLALAVNPLIALLRSVVAFAVLTLLGWAISSLWEASVAAWRHSRTKEGSKPSGQASQATSGAGGRGGGREATPPANR